MNIELLRAVQARITAEPRQFVMYDWFTRKLDESPGMIPNCGTAACVAGWAIALSQGLDPRAARDAHDATSSRYTTEQTAQQVLDIDHWRGSRLFYFTRWPAQFTLKPENDVAQACARIDYFIATNGTDEGPGTDVECRREEDSDKAKALEQAGGDK